VYDAARDRMLVLGGSGNDLWAPAFSGPTAGEWQRIDAAGEVPPPVSTVAIIDEGTGTLLVFANDSLDRAWSLPLGGGGAWSVSGFGAAPPIALGFSLAADAAGRRLFAYTSGTPEVWQLALDGGTAWQKVAGGPSVEGFSCRDDLVFDGTNERLLVLSGGWPRGDVYELSLGASPTWTQLNQGMAWFDYGSTSTFDAANGRFLVTGPDPESWLWSFAVGDPTGQWTHLKVGGTPPGTRMGASGIYDSKHERFVLFGGSSSNPDATTSLHDDTLAVTLGDAPSWSTVGTTNQSFQTTTNTTLAFDRSAGVVIRFGGQSATPEPTFLFDANSATWDSLHDAPPAAVAFAAGAWDPLSRRVVTFGGDAAVSLQQGETWSLSLFALPWSEIDGAGPRPPARNAHTMVSDPTGGRMIMLGGYTPGASFSVSLADTWQLDTKGNAWSKLEPAGPGPSPRGEHAAAFDDVAHRMLVHGGFDGVQYLSDTWLLELEPTPHWISLSPAGDGPPSVSRQFAAFDPGAGRFLVAASLPSATSATADGVAIWALTVDGAPRWSRYCPKGTRPATVDGAVWVNGALFVTSQGSAWRFDPATSTCD
jgi:hypothetical protein